MCSCTAHSTLTGSTAPSTACRACSYQNEMALRGHGYPYSPPAALSSAGIDKSVSTWGLGELCGNLTLGGLTCFEIPQSLAKPSQLGNTVFLALTPMSQAVDAGRD